MLVDPIHINNETPLLRTISLKSGIRVQAFTDAVCSRDRRCVITGQENLDDNDWVGFEAAHIFPLAYEQHWTGHTSYRAEIIKNYCLSASLEDSTKPGGSTNRY